jgi:dolichol-phosphate mannosyltransferase
VDAPARILVVVPTYEERGSLPLVLAEVRSHVPEATVLVVDDASPDGTGDAAEEFARQDGRVHVIHRPEKSGLGSAYRDGFAWGLRRGFDLFVEMDADLSHDPAQLPSLLRAARSADLVIGSRYTRGGSTVNWPVHRRALSRGGNRYVQLVTGTPVTDATSGYRAFRREVLEALDITSLDSEGYSFQVETALRAWRAGFRVREVPIRFVERDSGASKISRAIVLEAIWRVLIWGMRIRRGQDGPHRADEGTSAYRQGA